MRKLILGEIFKLHVKGGSAFLQYIYYSREMGYLIRVLDGIFEIPPTEFKELVIKKERFITYFPLGPAYNRKLVDYIKIENIPDQFKSKPPMRRAGGRKKDGKAMNWFIIDDEKEILVEKLNNIQKRYSIEAIWNDTLLKERIENNWTPLNDI